MNKKNLLDAKVLYDFLYINKTVKKADFMLVMGSHDVRAAHYATKLYKEYRADNIICTGGYGKITKKLWNKPESVKFSEILIKNGVPKSKIILEDKSTNTGDNFIYSKEIVKNLNLEFKTGIIVSKTYLSKRAYYTGLKQWKEIKWYIMSPYISFEDYPNNDLPLEVTLNLIVGDIQRLSIYHRKGYQEKVDIPEEVYLSYKRLRFQGFNEFLIK